MINNLSDPIDTTERQEYPKVLWKQKPDKHVQAPAGEDSQKSENGQMNNLESKMNFNLQNKDLAVLK